MSHLSELDPHTPVIVGVGQFAERIDSPGYRGYSPIELAVLAARAAIEDTGALANEVAALVDTIAATRQFEDSGPGVGAPLGKSTRYPLSVARRLGLTPRRAVLEVAGGQSPQHLVTEFSREIASGSAEAVLLVGAEAISTIRDLAKADVKPDFSDDPTDPEGTFADRGFGLKGLVSHEQMSHGLTNTPAQYALLENARRAALGVNRNAYAVSMGELFAPFTRVAAANPFSASKEHRSARELIEASDRNRMIADPYTRFLVARDHVNQAAAVLITSLSTAHRLGIDPAKYVFLHGQADLQERTIMERADLGVAPSAAMAVAHALEVAQVKLDDITFFDLYSCFPIAVSNIADQIGLSPTDPRGLTLTGGLPFFGGAGNNYSMHAIAEAAGRVRSAPGTFALVSANGGMLSKTSAGVYGTAPCALREDDSARLQRQIDEWAKPAHDPRPHGWATIETFTIHRGRDGDTGIVIGRLEASDARFLALAAEKDTELMALLETADQPVGARVFVTPTGPGNRVTLTDVSAKQLYARPVHLRDDYQHARVERDGRVLIVTINRPEVRNALHPPANDELGHIFDYYFADPELWVAIITGAGDKAFSAGNDLAYSVSGKPLYVPLNGFGGLTHRRGMNKPVIAAVNGSAMGGGFEIVLACHLVVADTTATFALSEVKVGLIAAAGGLVRLPRRVPPVVANEMILTGWRIGALEAHRLGVVNRVVPPGTALEAARELAAEIADVSPTSVRLSLQAMSATQRVADPVDAIDAQTPIVDELITSADSIEGMTAFAMKRKPEWRNR
ncbi:acetyl-CoA acetyltransferase [Mycobacterium sp. RTGN3]|uniref:acetyl-CoA acetyltransferase n=1 Tax=unclassified Mycobacterium TaxID=2642494 RepID=UPI0039B018BC